MPRWNSFSQNWNSAQQALTREKVYGGYTGIVDDAQPIPAPTSWVDAMEQQNTVIQPSPQPPPRFEHREYQGILPDTIKQQFGGAPSSNELTPELVLLFVLIIMMVVAIKSLYNIERMIANYHNINTRVS